MTDQFHLEGRTLPFHLPRQFERFYRENLRRVIGSRLRSADLLAAYLEWATANGEGSMTFGGIRSCLEAIGHRRLTSNGRKYVDVAFARDYPELPDTLQLPLMVRASQRHDARCSDLIVQVDSALASLLDIRRELLAAEDSRAPYVAAQRALGRLNHLS